MTEWKPPTEYPNLSGARLIGVDLETRDPHLMEMGPGGVRGDGYIIGASLAVEDGDQVKGWYFPIRHDGGGNLDVENTLRWLSDTLGTGTPKVGANIIYDLEWLTVEGVKVGGPKYDVQIAEPLLDENKMSYSLQNLALAYFNEVKDETELLQAAISIYGLTEKNLKGEMWRMHSKHVGAYGEKDATLPLRIFREQEKRIAEEELQHVFQMETQLVDLLLAMRLRGIPVDIERAIRTKEMMDAKQREIMKRLRDQVGSDVDIWSGKSLQYAADHLGLQYPLTDKGNASFEAAWLEAQEGISFYRDVVAARKLDRAGGVFIQSKILDLQHNGRIYPRFRQVRGDDKGTRSGRFSSEGPNMQQVPARDPFIAPLVRSLFIPENGCEWGSLDYSQQEPRVTVHYAALCEFSGADEAVRRYRTNPKTDYHQMTADMVQEFAGIRIDRKLVAKPMNLGLAYGMGKDKMASTLGLSRREADPIFRAYHKALPYVKLLGDEAARLATERGFIRTISGRRRRFNLFGPRGWKPGIVPKHYDAAVEEWGPGVVRYFTHKALNALIQGTSADMIKKAMLDCFEAGHVPHITVHDELCFSIESREKLREIKQIMESVYELQVPIMADVDVGPSWGEAKTVDIEKSSVQKEPQSV